MSTEKPNIKILINYWTFWHQKNEQGTPLTLEEEINRVKKAGFDAYTCPADKPQLKDLLTRANLRFGAAFDAAKPEQFEKRIKDGLAIDNGPMNCQLGDHDTSIEDGIELTIQLMEEAERQGAEVHLEMHRDTCTETPEKTYAIAEGFKKAKGHYPLINFDFSHPASLKHLQADNYVERLFENIELFQQCSLWHMRPFNGHHCQVPVTNGKGGFSPEYEDMRPFIKQAFEYWLDGPRPNNELWVCPELGPKGGYGISCFPDSWQDTIVLGNDIRKIWNETLNN